MDLEHTTDLLRPLPAHTSAAQGVLARWVLRLTGATWRRRAARSRRRTASYDTRVPMREGTQRVHLVDPPEHGCPCRGRGLEAEDQGWLEGGQAETPAVDG